MLVKVDTKMQLGFFPKAKTRKWRLVVVVDGKSRVLVSANTESELVGKVLAKFE
jgi:hypothetical protein